eukprot:CAMPEP_0116867464 /NCGR_PEP_ID=MMETSP0418-20121206/26640_1 /TAXON_ID=1158023 /ORGANISM="Astrosyne radiata, Strain 13vi08-1A" /LENGTH=135 /DNA_ID=CAMNT_0004503295 /DNA_START=563 /DNA_END=968 /DNA_ORIENTATION=-
MNKRVRDGTFKSLLRQEVSYFDTNPVAILTTKLSKDAAVCIVDNGDSSVYGFWYGNGDAMCVGEDEGDVTEEKENSPGSVVVETLTNIRTVASLAIEDTRAEEYEYALHHEEKNPLRTNLVKGAAFGLGQFVQMW